MFVAITIAALLQPLSDAIPEPAPLSDPVSIIASVCNANQSGTTADRVRITTSSARDDARVLTMTFRRSVTDETTLTRVDLPEVVFFHDGQVLRAERVGEGNHVVVFETDASSTFVEAISEVAPVWPMPRLWSIDAQGHVRDPALGLVHFQSAMIDGSIATLVGQSPAGDVTVLVDTNANSILSIEAPLRDGWFACSFTPIEPEDPESWRIKIDDRWVVHRLAQLALTGPPIEVGVTLPDLRLLTPDYEGIALSDIQSLEQIRRAGPWVVLLILRADASNQTYTQAGEVARGVWSDAATEIAQLGRDNAARYWLGHRCLVVAVTPDLDILPDRVSEIAKRSPPGVPTLISTEPEMTIDRLEPDTPLIAVLIDPQRTVGAVVPIENAETGVSAILDAMRSYTRPTEPATDPVLSSE